MPVYLIRFNFGLVRFNLLDILISLTIIIWLKEKGFKEIKDYFKNINKIYLSLILLLLLSVLFSIYFNGNKMIGWGMLKSYFLLPILFAFVVKDVFYDNEKNEKILYVIFSSGLGVAIISLFYKLAGKVTYDNRLEAFFNSPNYLAMYLAPSIIINFSLLFQKNIWYKITFFFLVIILYWTTSYGAWLAMGGTLIFIDYEKNRKKFKSWFQWIEKSLLLKILLIFLLIVVVLQNNNSKWQNLWNWSERSSENSRLIIWRSAVKIVQDNWIWGIGPGNFQEQYLMYQKYFPPYLEWAVPQPHNLWLAFWLQTGLLGLLSFLGLIFYFYKKSFYFLKKTKTREKEIIITFMALLLYWLGHGIVDTTFWKNDLALMFWSVLSLVF